MDRSTAERWVTISALVVAAVYGYRRVTEATSSPVTLKKLVGIGNPVPLGAFATAWGFTFLVIAVIAEAAPGMGAGFAILVATTDVLVNGQDVLADVGKQTSAQAASAATTATGQTQTAAGVNNPNKTVGGVQVVAGTTTTGIGKIGTATTGF